MIFRSVPSTERICRRAMSGIIWNMVPTLIYSLAPPHLTTKPPSNFLHRRTHPDSILQNFVQYSSLTHTVTPTTVVAKLYAPSYSPSRLVYMTSSLQRHPSSHQRFSAKTCDRHLSLPYRPVSMPPFITQNTSWAHAAQPPHVRLQLDP
ncbi:hypothetical protein JAAARDRAFT_660128 [Jaapia argillacea MUCL 33604]|uniref:Uncharacterized protein n=1 Tax=Jaapia argillacea MUCL 33604 TaxID=933084 RepID=A0A067PZN6_9AGAM|nr:hypothetical protein JAAARDRAFT_660128 [Jaapia argillacea MUCL 33604]